MSDNRLELYTALVTVVIGGIELFLTQLSSGAPAWFPSFGTTGETLSVYMALSSGFVTVLTGAIAVGFGIAMARRIDLSRAYRPFLRSVAVGVTVGIVAGMLLMMAVGGVASSLPATGTLQTPGDLVQPIAVVVSQIGGAILSEGIPLLAMIFAGAALGQFQDGTQTASSLDEETAGTLGDD